MHDGGGVVTPPNPHSGSATDESSMMKIHHLIDNICFEKKVVHFCPPNVNIYYTLVTRFLHDLGDRRTIHRFPSVARVLYNLRTSKSHRKWVTVSDRFIDHRQNLNGWFVSVATMEQNRFEMDKVRTSRATWMGQEINTHHNKALLHCGGVARNLQALKDRQQTPTRTCSHTVHVYYWPTPLRFSVLHYCC